MAQTSRDDFRRSIQVDLSIRAGLCCSNPKCGVLTKGPADRPVGVISIGIAAHIKAAAPGGPRYDVDQSAGERASIENGIWLCANCARIVDGDAATYTVAVLQEWRRKHEEEVRRSIGRLPDEPSKLPELPVEERYLDQKGIRQKLSADGFTIMVNYRHQANTKVGLGEADFIVDPDTPEGPVRLVLGNTSGEDLVFLAIPTAR